MNSYHETLDAFLSAGSMSERDLADAVGKAQGSINRYRNKERFPNADTARLIDRATDGKVPFAVWQADFMARSGLAA